MAKKEVEKEPSKEEKTKKDKKIDKKPKKEKKPGLFKKIKDSVGELKKVTWASFGTVVKKTGVVLLVVLIFTVVLFAMDFGLGELFKLFMS